MDFPCVSPAMVDYWRVATRTMTSGLPSTVGHPDPLPDDDLKADWHQTAVCHRLCLDAFCESFFIGSKQDFFTLKLPSNSR